MHIPCTDPGSSASNLLRAVFNNVDPIELPDLPHISRGTFAGIIVAISGNILISLALNCQKLAHKRLEREREAQAQELQGPGPGPGHTSRPDAIAPVRATGIPLGTDEEDAAGDEEYGLPMRSPPLPAVIIESEPLLQPTNGTNHSRYGTQSSTQSLPREKPTFLSKLFIFRKRDKLEHIVRDADGTPIGTTHCLTPVDGVPARIEPLADGTENGTSTRPKPKRESSDGNEGDYLKSKLWWSGFLLMNVGECGNFISYAFAPASLVAPLGTFALIANCLFAPLMLKERFRKRDFFGIMVAIVGAVTVVLSTNTSDVRLGPSALVEAITQRPFVVYSIVYIAGIVILSGLSEGRAGKKWVYVDVGLCAFFGGFTVLSTKAISTLLTLEWLEIFTEWITYPVIAILLLTGVGQIKYLNRALMRFDSKIVVPTQFVLFNLSAIVGSAILYGDFKQASFHEIITFLYGCAATFAGVFIIAWAPASADEGADETLVEESDHGDTFPYNVAGDSTPAGSMRGMGSIARRNRVRSAVADYTPGSPILRNRNSIVGYGLSPAQHVLMLSSSPTGRAQSQDVERGSPDTYARQRAVSWMGDGTLGRGGLAPRRHVSTSNFGTRENSRDATDETERARRSPSPF